MSICAKCNTSIKPASLATSSGDDKFHPTCISCVKCDRPLWGRGFRRNKQRKLECDPDCETNGPIAAVNYHRNRPSSGSREYSGGGPPIGSGPKGFKPIYDDVQSPAKPPQPAPAPPSAQPQPKVSFGSVSSASYPPQSPYYPPQQQQQQVPPPPQLPYDPSMYRKQGTDLNGSLKTCKSCGQSLHNRRYITYETGDTICQDCDYKSRNPIVIIIFHNLSLFNYLINNNKKDS